jgi:hypothetical protein
MKPLTMTVISLPLLALAPARADQTNTTSGDGAPAVEIVRSGSQPSTQGAPEYFTGAVRIDPLFQAADPSRTSGGLVPLHRGFDGLGWLQKGQASRVDKHLDAARHPRLAPDQARPLQRNHHLVR